MITPQRTRPARTSSDSRGRPSGPSLLKVRIYILVPISGTGKIFTFKYSIFDSLDGGLLWLSKEWKLCKNLTSDNVNELVDWLGDVYANLAMANYPYPANFLAELPAYPIRMFCKKLQNRTATGKDLLRDLFGGISLYFNHTGRAQCLNWKQNTSSLGDVAWDYQVDLTREILIHLRSDFPRLFQKNWPKGNSCSESRIITTLPFT